jgi:hypothetical protein
MRRFIPILLPLAACDAASSDSARDAMLQVPDAQWRPGPLPDPAGGPDVVLFEGLRPTVIVPTVGEPLHGAAGPGATAVAVMMDGDAGAWLYPAGAPSVELPTSPSFDRRVGFAQTIPLGPITLSAVAFDADGRPGAPTTLPLVAMAAPPPTGTLVVSLVWLGPADFDIHVVDPLGGEAWAEDPNTWEPPPPGSGPPDPNAWMTGGILTHDANADCHRDGAPAEHVVWQMPPPPGDYLVRVDTRSLCGAPTATWAVSVQYGDQILASTRGTSLPDDVLQPHGPGSGVLAARFTIPPP